MASKKTLTGRHERRSIDFEFWPERDRQRWQNAFATAGFLCPAGKAAHWRPATALQVLKGHALWLGFLAAQSLLDPGAEPWERITERHLRDYIEDLRRRDLASTTIASRITDLREAIRIMLPNSADSSVLVLLSRTISHLRQIETPRRNKGARVIHPLRIFDAAVGFLDDIETLPCPNDLIRSTWYRDTLLLAWLTMRPIRLRNIAAIQFGKHLTKSGDLYSCRFAAEETKEHRPLEFHLPKVLSPYIDHYIELHLRRLLGDRESSDLWITVRRGRMTAQTVYWSVCKMSKRLLGVQINPHLFRDCVATWFATDDPEHLHAAARILGHATLKTTEASYNQAQMLAAVRDHQKTIMNILLEAMEKP
jgi:integrase